MGLGPFRRRGAEPLCRREAVPLSPPRGWAPFGTMGLGSCRRRGAGPPCCRGAGPLCRLGAGPLSPLGGCAPLAAVGQGPYRRSGARPLPAPCDRAPLATVGLCPFAALGLGPCCRRDARPLLPPWCRAPLAAVGLGPLRRRTYIRNTHLHHPLHHLRTRSGPLPCCGGVAAKSHGNRGPAGPRTGARTSPPRDGGGNKGHIGRCSLPQRRAPPSPPRSSSAPARPALRLPIAPLRSAQGERVLQCIPPARAERLNNNNNNKQQYMRICVYIYIYIYIYISSNLHSSPQP